MNITAKKITTIGNVRNHFRIEKFLNERELNGIQLNILKKIDRYKPKNIPEEVVFFTKDYLQKVDENKILEFSEKYPTLHMISYAKKEEDVIQIQNHKGIHIYQKKSFEEALAQMIKDLEILEDDFDD